MSLYFNYFWLILFNLNFEAELLEFENYPIRNKYFSIRIIKN